MDLMTESQRQLERDEGRKPKIYYDTLNIPTIGIGFNLKEGLDNEEIDFIFQHRWKRILAELKAKAPFLLTLDDARLGALMNMAYNMGIPRLLGFTKMLEALSVGDYVKAGNEARNSFWYSQVGSRAVRIVEQIETGVWK